MKDMKTNNSPFSWLAQYSETDEPDKHGRWARLCYYRGYVVAKVSKQLYNDVICYCALGYFPSGGAANPQYAGICSTLDEAKILIEERFTKFISDCSAEPRIFGTKYNKRFWSDKPIQPGHPEYKEPKKRGIEVSWVGAFCIFYVLAIEIVILYYVFMAIFEKA